MWEKVVVAAPILVAAFGSAGIVKLIDFWIERKRIKLQKKDNIESEKYVTKAQLEEVKNEIRKDNEELRKLLMDKTGVLCEAQKISMRSRINQLGTGYIKQGWISSQNLEIIIEMHESYHKLGGNGHLDSIMEQVKQLQIK